MQNKPAKTTQQQLEIRDGRDQPAVKDNRNYLQIDKSVLYLKKHTVKIRSYKNGDRNDEYLRTRLCTHYPFLYGQKDPFTPEQRDFIHNFAREELKDLSVQEIDKALHLAANGKFDKWDDKLGTYGNFSVEYLGKVCKYYRRHLKEQEEVEYKEQQRKKRIEENAKHEEIIANQTDKEWYDRLVALIRENGKFPDRYGGFSEVYAYLKETGKINPSPEEAIKFAEQVKVELREEAEEYSKESREHVSKVLKEWLKPNSFKVECRKRYIKKWMEEDGLLEELLGNNDDF